MPGAPQWQGTQLGRPQPTTPDGAVLSGWWRRVVARVVDGIICGLVTVAVTYPWLTRAAGIMNGYFRDTFDAAANGGTARAGADRARLGAAAGQPGQPGHLLRLRGRAAHPSSPPRPGAFSSGI